MTNCQSVGLCATISLARFYSASDGEIPTRRHYNAMIELAHVKSMQSAPVNEEQINVLFSLVHHKRFDVSLN